MARTSKSKTKITLSNNLKLGVAAPASQSAFFKYGGVIFLVLALVLAINIFRTLHADKSGAPKILTSAQLQQQVLGAYDPGSDGNGGAGAGVGTTNYTVQSGDTIFVIAQNLHIDWQMLANLNHLKPPFTIKIGQVLKVPSQQ